MLLSRRSFFVSVTLPAGLVFVTARAAFAGGESDFQNGITGTTTTVKKKKTGEKCCLGKRKILAMKALLSDILNYQNRVENRIQLFERLAASSIDEIGRYRKSHPKMNWQNNRALKVTQSNLAYYKRNNRAERVRVYDKVRKNIAIAEKHCRLAGKQTTCAGRKFEMRIAVKFALRALEKIDIGPAVGGGVIADQLGQPGSFGKIKKKIRKTVGYNRLIIRNLRVNSFMEDFIGFRRRANGILIC